MSFPKTGLAEKDILTHLEANKSGDIPWQSGKTFAYTYDAGPEAMSIVHKAFDSYLTENALDPTAFPSILNLENEVIGMAAELMHGDENCAGTMTSGGTESILLMMKAVRDYNREHRPHIKEPEVILPSTAHPAFHKGCHYFDLKVVPVTVETDSYTPDPANIEKAITDNTVLIVGSTPSYAHCVVDPIIEMAAIAQSHNIFFHVDACVGGFYLPFVEMLGYPLAHFDFRVPGVTSISMDIHKFGYAAKGASIILYKHKDLRKYQIYGCARYPGYVVVNPTITSSKGGGPVAAAWAVMKFLGQDGYKKIVAETKAASEKLINGVNDIAGLKVLGQPAMNMISIAADSANVFSLIELMKTKGWHLQAQFENVNSPSNMHLTVCRNNIPQIDQLLQDLAESVRLIDSGEIKKVGTENIPKEFLHLLENLTPETFEQVTAMFGAGGNDDDGDLTEHMGEINTMLNQLSPPAREKLLIEFLSKLYSAQ